MKLHALTDVTVSEVLVEQTRPFEILSVEDSLGDQRLISEFLGGEGTECNIHFASTGKEALQYLSREGRFKNAPPPDLVLLDLNLPLFDGKEVLRLLKSSPNTSHVPVVVFSTSSDQDDVFRSYQLHANCYYTKPAELESYEAVMKTIREHWLTAAALPEPVRAIGGH